MCNRCAASPSPRVESDWAAEAAWTSHHPHTLPHSACYVSGSQPFWGWGPPPPTFHFILSLPRLLVRVSQHIYRKRCCKIQGDRFLTEHICEVTDSWCCNHQGVLLEDGLKKKKFQRVNAIITSLHLSLYSCKLEFLIAWICEHYLCDFTFDINRQVKQNSTSSSACFFVTSNSACVWILVVKTFRCLFKLAHRILPGLPSSLQYLNFFYLERQYQYMCKY